MNIEELYLKETGDKATYRKDSSDYHTLKYVRWLECKFEKLEKENENLKTAYQDMGVERDNALVAYENSQCCGNCINYGYDMEEDRHYCNKHIYSGKRHAGICTNNWQSDNLTRKERET